MFILRKLLSLIFFAVLVITINTWALRISTGTDADSISSSISEASQISQDRISKATSDIVQDKFGSESIVLDQSSIDSSVAEDVDALSDASDSTVARWLTDQTSKIDTSAITDDLQSLIDDAMSAVRQQMESLPACQSDSQFTSLEDATCRPSDAMLQSEIARVRQELIAENTTDVQPPVWMRLLGTIYSLSGGFAYFLLIVCAALGAVIIFSYGPRLNKGLRKFGSNLSIQSLIIAFGAGLSLVFSSALLSILGGNSLVEALTEVSGIKIIQNWQSTTLIVSLAVAALGIIIYFVGRLLKGRGSKQAKSSRKATPSSSQSLGDDPIDIYQQVPRQPVNTQNSTERAASNDRRPHNPTKSN